jgi:hypothetical protein
MELQAVDSRETIEQISLETEVEAVQYRPSTV